TRAVAVILYRQGLAGAVADQLGNARKVLDRLAVDLEQQVTDLQPCRLGRAILREAADDRADELVHAQLAEAQRVVVAIGPLAELRLDLAMQHLVAAPVVDRHRLGPVEALGLL